MAVKMHPSISVHAGRWLMSEIVHPSGRSITELAAEMGVSRQALSTVQNGASHFLPHKFSNTDPVDAPPPPSGTPPRFARGRKGGRRDASNARLAMPLS
jgi:hypothetical protein